MTTATSASENRPHDLRRKRTGQRAVRSRSSSSHTSRSTTAHRVSILTRRADQVVRATTNHAPLYMT